ncbi:hypothetical protein BKA69DRAFT_1105683 [Paraphysoderma sedebokerense]|nr:hypothetical protein BKA69DRAFT_1105683 [Paraphysoderma sedebokerense]
MAQLTKEFVDYLSSLLAKNAHASEINGKGHGLICDQEFKPGDDILIEDPYAAVLNDRSLSNHCSCCFVSGSDAKLSRCSKCRLVYYCSTQCQKIDWIHHQQECQGFIKLSPKQPKSIVRSICRVLRRRYRDLNSGGNDSIKPKFSFFANCVSHRSDFPPERLEDLVSGLALVKMCVGERMIPTDASSFIEMCCKMSTNGFTILSTAEELEPIGYGLYLGASMINHSCNPNAVALFNGAKLHVKCIRPIKTGEEITINYVDTLQPTALRRQELKSNFFFSCSCELCQNHLNGETQSEEMREAIQSPYSHESPEVTSLLADNDKYIKLLKSEGTKGNMEFPGQLENHYSNLRRYLHPLNYHYLQFANSYFSFLVKATNFDIPDVSSSPISQHLLSVSYSIQSAYQHYFPSLHPVLLLMEYNTLKLETWQIDESQLRNFSKLGEIKQKFIDFIKKCGELKKKYEIMFGKHSLVYRRVVDLDNNINETLREIVIVMSQGIE